MAESDYARNLSGRIGLDTTDFKTGAAALNRELRVLESGWKASEESLGDWAKTESGLEGRIETLTKKIDAQGLKVQLTRAEHERMVAAHGEHSKAAQELEIKLNKENETLNKMQAELKDDQSALKNLGSSSETASTGVQELDSSTQKTTGSLKGLLAVAGTVAAGLAVVAAAVAALAAGAIAGGVAVAGLVFKLAEAGDNISETAEKYGIGVEKFQEYVYAGKILGTDIDTIAGAHTKLTRAMDAAKKPESDQAQAFAALGINIRDATGKFRSADDVFSEALDKLGGVGDETERDILSMTLFGKSAMELNPLINAGSKGLKELADQARASGAIMGKDTVEAAGKFQDQIDALKMSGAGLVMKFASGFLPLFSSVATLLQSIGSNPMVQAFFNNLGTSISKDLEPIGLLIDNLMKFGPTSVAVRDALQGIFGTKLGAQIFRAVDDIFGAIKGLQSGDLGGLKKLFTDLFGPEIGGAISKAIDDIVTAFGHIKKFWDENGPAITAAFQQVADKAKTVMTDLTAKIIPFVSGILVKVSAWFSENGPLIQKYVQTMADVWTNSLLPAVTAAWSIISPILGGLIDLILGIAKTVMQIATGDWAGAWETFKGTVKGAIEAIDQACLNFVDWVASWVGTSWQGIVDTWNSNWAMLGIIVSTVWQQIITGISDFFVNLGATLTANWEMFKLIVSTLWTNLVTGISDTIGTIADTISTAVQGWIDAIRSRVKDFGDIAKNLVQAVADGIKNNAQAVLSAITGMVNGAIQAAKNLLGIHSPSKVGWSLGENFGSTLGDAVFASLKDIEDRLGKAMGGLSQTAWAGAGAGGGMGSRDQYLSIYGPMTFQGDLPPGGVQGIILGDRRY